MRVQKRKFFIKKSFYSPRAGAGKSARRIRRLHKIDSIQKMKLKLVFVFKILSAKIFSKARGLGAKMGAPRFKKGGLLYELIFIKIFFLPYLIKRAAAGMSRGAAALRRTKRII